MHLIIFLRYSNTTSEEDNAAREEAKRRNDSEENHKAVDEAVAGRNAASLASARERAFRERRSKLHTSRESFVARRPKADMWGWISRCQLETGHYFNSEMGSDNSTYKVAAIPVGIIETAGGTIVVCVEPHNTPLVQDGSYGQPVSEELWNQSFSAKNDKERDKIKASF